MHRGQKVLVTSRGIELNATNKQSSLHIYIAVDSAPDVKHGIARIEHDGFLIPHRLYHIGVQVSACCDRYGFRALRVAAHRQLGAGIGITRRSASNRHFTALANHGCDVKVAIRKGTA